MISFQQLTSKRDAICFAATVMWFSPLTTELLIPLRRYFQGELWDRLNYLVLGGNGVMDTLFYGFWAFLSMTFFSFIEQE
jgi:hypothetical protein